MTTAMAMTMAAMGIATPMAMRRLKRMKRRWAAMVALDAAASAPATAASARSVSTPLPSLWEETGAACKGQEEEGRCRRALTQVAGCRAVAGRLQGSSLSLSLPGASASEQPSARRTRHTARGALPPRHGHGPRQHAHRPEHRHRHCSRRRGGGGGGRVTVAGAQESEEARVVRGAELRVGRGAQPGEVDGVGGGAGAQ